MSEFKATHRFNGEDDGVLLFEAGDEVMFVRSCNEISDDLFDEVGMEENGVFVNSAGDEQYAYYTSMEAI